MVLQCDKCGRNFLKKGDYTRHINRKKPCTQQTTYQCDLCGQMFNQRSNYTRHMNRITPCVPHEEALLYYRKQLYEALKRIETQKNDLVEKDIKINKLEKHVGSSVAVIGNENVVGNTTNNNTTNINMTVNVTQINAFGYENTDYITDADYQQAYDLGLKGLQLLVHKKYLNPKHPENWNVGITNLRGDTCKVVTNKGIQTQIKDDVTDLMYRNTNIDLEEYEGNQEIDRPETHEIDRALFTDSKDTSRKYTRFRRQTEVKIYNQKSDRQMMLDVQGSG